MTAPLKAIKTSLDLALATNYEFNYAELGEPKG